MLTQLFKVLIMFPVILVSSCAAGGYIIGLGDFNWWAASIASVVAVGFWFYIESKKANEGFIKRMVSLGMEPEYHTGYGDNGIGIDRKNKKIFAGPIKTGKALDFSEISSIETGWHEMMGHDKYLIHINTNNFEDSRITIGFADRKLVRDDAYAKLRLALNLE